MKTRIITTLDMMLLEYQGDIIPLKGDKIHLQEGVFEVMDKNFKPNENELDIIVKPFFVHNGIDYIAKERKRQLTELGFDYANDSLYSDNQLANAAICYAMKEEERDLENDQGISLNIAIWPWDQKYFKPTPEDRIKELSKAGALIAAQIDYLINNQ